MTRPLLNLLTALSLLLCAAAGGCSSHNAALSKHTAESRDAPAAPSADLEGPPDVAPSPDLRRREPWLPSVQEDILRLRPTFLRQFEALQRQARTMRDPGASEQEKLEASVGLRVARAELRRASMHLIDLIDPPMDSAGIPTHRGPVLEVRDDPRVYTADLPPYDGSAHGDGVAGVDVTGVVVEEIGGDERPVAGVRFSVEPDRSFAEWANNQVVFLSNAEGEFLARVYLGAAMTAGGKRPGTVYQTRPAKLLIEKEGYRPQSVFVDYKMPPVKVFLKRM